MDQNLHLNKHGVEGIFESSGHFGCYNKEGVFENCAIFIPLVCVTCVHYDPGEPGDYGSKVGAPYCAINCFFPVKKGTCKRKKPLRRIV